MLQPVRNVKDFWAGIIYIGVGAAAIMLGREYDMGTAMKMGPAYFPVILSILLIGIGAVSVVRSFVKHGDPIGTFSIKGLFLIIASIALFGFMIRSAGLIIALPVFVILSSFASARFRWHYSLMLAAGLTVFCYFVFLKGLGVPLPILGSWFGE